MSTLLLAAALIAIGPMPIGIGPLPSGDAAHAQGVGGVGGAGKGLARAFGRGGPTGLPGLGGRDFGQGNIGRGNIGQGNIGRGDFGRGDFGRGDFGRGDFGRRDFGHGNFDRGEFHRDRFDRDRFDRDRFDRDNFDRFDRDRFRHEAPAAHLPGFRGGLPGAGGHFCPPGLADKGCFPPGAQRFLHGACPPGLAGGGCLPPGLRAFAPGDRIPRHIGYQRIFHRDFGLPAPAHGFHYGRIADDVYLVSEGTRQVVHAISLIGAAR